MYVFCSGISKGLSLASLEAVRIPHIVLSLLVCHHAVQPQAAQALPPAVIAVLFWCLLHPGYRLKAQKFLGAWNVLAELAINSSD